MMNLRRVIGLVAWSFLAVCVPVGCAHHDAAASRTAMVGADSADTAALEGVWEGEVWETAAFYVQGVRRVAVKISMISLARVGERVSEAARTSDKQ